MSALACGPGSVTFQFRPDEGANYHLREAQEVRSTTTARGGVGVERAAMAARMEVTRPDSWRWGFVVTIEEMELYDEGVRRTGDDPGLAAFIGTPLTVEVWEDGTVAAVKGTEAIDRKLRAAAGRAGEPPVLGLAFARGMEAAEEEEWAERVAALVGHEAAAGDRWEESLECRLPTGGGLTVTREVAFEGWEECGTEQCARLVYSDRGGGTDWSSPLERAINGFARTLCPNARRIEVLEVAVSGEGERLVEPATLVTYRDSSERRFELRVRLDGGEEREVAREETRTLETERLN